MHEGMIGIIAGKITESTGLPSIVLTDDPENKEIVKGSARSIEGFNIVKYLQDINAGNPDLFAGFGGHQGFAGLSVRREHLKDFIVAKQIISRYRCHPLMNDRMSRRLFI